MDAIFANAITRLNTSVMDRLSDVVATVAGVQCKAIFDSTYTTASIGTYGMASSVPAITLATGSVPVNPVGVAVQVVGTSYTVAEHHPDGTGMSVLLLQGAA